MRSQCVGRLCRSCFCKGGCYCIAYLYYLQVALLYIFETGVCYIQHFSYLHYLQGVGAVLLAARVFESACERPDSGCCGVDGGS